MSKVSEFDGATCSACDSPLDRRGYCKNEYCGYSCYSQDQPGGWQINQRRGRVVRALRRWEQGCVVANTRSRQFYLPDDRAYPTAKRAKHVRFFKTPADAEAVGFHRAPQTATERQLNRIAKLGRWGHAERFDNLVMFLRLEGRVGDFLDFVGAEEAERKDLDFYISKVGPDAFEREIIRYLEESGASLTALWNEARENPVNPMRDHF